jgi:tetratricopeptide (TPR) repeat protein
MRGQVESQKCLANVELCGNGTPVTRVESATGDATAGGYKPEAVDAALGRLDTAQKLAPQDLSVYRSKLHVLEISGRFSDMVQVLDDACTVYKGSDALQTWLALSDELMDLHQYKVGLAFAQVVDKYFPNTAAVYNEIGTFLSLLGRNQEGILYLQKAVSLAPKNSTDVWSLARAYDAANQNDLANRWYKKALPMARSADELRDETCSYAKFVETKLQDRNHACSMEKMSCDDAAQQTACAPAASASAPSTAAQSK